MNQNVAQSVVTSMYVSEFPEVYTAKNLFELFGCSGNVVEVSISPRRNKFCKRFGFARFSDVEDGRLLAIRLDNIFIAGRKIHVNLPRYKRALIGEKGRLGVSGRVSANRASYKGKEISKTIVSAANRRNFFSYAEAVGKDVVGYVKKEDKKILLNFQFDCDLRSRFEKAYVGKVSILGSSYNSQTHLEVDGCLRSKSLLSVVTVVC